MGLTSVVAFGIALLLLLAPHLSVQVPVPDSLFNISNFNGASNPTVDASTVVKNWSSNALRDVATSELGNALRDVTNATVDSSTVVKDWSSNALRDVATSGLGNALRDVTNATVDSSTVVKDWSTNATEAITKATPECWGLIGGIAVVTFFSIILALPWFLLALGFGALGPVAGGLAALLQPFCGLSLVFACLQSSAMTLASGFFNCGRGQAVFAFTCWIVTIPLSLLAAAGAGYGGFVHLPQCHETVNVTDVMTNLALDL